MILFIKFEIFKLCVNVHVFTVSNTMKKLSFKTDEAHILEVSDNYRKYLFLFFIHHKNNKPQWRLTSYVNKIMVTAEGARITTQNSIYNLTTHNINYQKLSSEEFLICRQGFAPDEAKFIHQMMEHGIGKFH